MIPAGRPGAGWTVTVVTAAAVAVLLFSVTAAQHTSATFDEAVLVAAGVRGVVTGRWEMVIDQPPLAMYAYGLASRGTAETLPPEDVDGWAFEQRWTYARQLFFRLGNDADTILERARWVAAATATLVVLAAGAAAWWAAGPAAAVLAALFTALLPDVLAHGGVAYNDLPLALFFLLAAWALDAAVRRPTPWRGALAGAAVAGALGVKLSALALGPVALVLAALETVHRSDSGAWWRDLTVSGLVGILSAYVVMVVLYRGDTTLTLFRFNFHRTVLHAATGHPAPAYLLGRTSETGFWYFFPVAFLLKTPVGFQVALSVAVGLGLRELRHVANTRPGETFQRLAGWRGRGAVVGAAVFGIFLVRSNLNAGFRYALPVLPLLAVAAGTTFARFRHTHTVRWTLAALLALQSVSTLSAYPHMLAYSSILAGGRDEAHHMLVDSSLDWGQGLKELDAFMEDEGVERVALSYFGSVPPEAYGIAYEALPSFFRLEGGLTPHPTSSPRFTVISVTNLHGLYLQGRDPFADYRDREPYRVLGHTLLVFDEGQHVQSQAR